MKRRTNPRPKVRKDHFAFQVRIYPKNGQPYERQHFVFAPSLTLAVAGFAPWLANNTSDSEILACELIDPEREFQCSETMDPWNLYDLEDED